MTADSAPAGKEFEKASFGVESMKGSRRLLSGSSFCANAWTSWLKSQLSICSGLLQYTTVELPFLNYRKVPVVTGSTVVHESLKSVVVLVVRTPFL